MLSEISYRDLHISQSAPDISVYATHCIRHRRHLKRRLRQYGRIG